MNLEPNDRSRRPTRATVAGRAYLDLQTLARRQPRPTDELQQLYALEGFLTRLAQSAHADQLVLKGGVLLAAYGARRPTRDIDIAARRLSGTIDDVLQLVRDIASTPVDDGLDFDPTTATAETIRDAGAYHGVRVALTATLATARLSLHVDVNIGDPITPPPAPVDLPRLLGGTLTLIGYPLPMVLAEKIITALERGTLNTRRRDYADVHLLTGHHAINGDDLAPALSDVAAPRDITVTALSGVLDGYAAAGQPRWTAWRRRQHVDDRLPASFAQVVDNVTRFADPALADQTRGQTWDPHHRSWQPSTR